jgi:putative tryptophan/tyrosine transport system substrate-binding protein
VRRREFITGSAAAVWASPAQAQQHAMPTIGFLSLSSEGGIRPYTEAFRSGLAALGYAEGKNIRVLYRFGNGSANRLSPLAVELVSSGAIVIVTHSNIAIRATHDATPNVPIVSWWSSDPIMMGWAQTLARPGGMITGLFLAADTVLVKRFELLKELRPQATTFGLLLNVTNPGNPQFRRIAGDAAHALGIRLEIIEVKEPAEVLYALDRMRLLGVEGLSIPSDPMLNPATIAELARINKLASVGDGRSFANAGGLFAYEFDYAAMAMRSAWYVDQILRGIPPGELPAEIAREFKLIVNRKIAKELGITIPPSVLARADELIE